MRGDHDRAVVPWHRAVTMETFEDEMFKDSFCTVDVLQKLGNLCMLRGDLDLADTLLGRYVGRVLHA